MTREQTKQLLPILKAYANGETIEFYSSFSSYKKRWIETNNLDFCNDPENYRIKTKPVEGWAIVDTKGWIVKVFKTEKEATNAKSICIHRTEIVHLVEKGPKP